MDGCKHTCRQCRALENPNLPTRFWSKVNKGDACWIWQGATNSKGYGRFDIGGYPGYAHRVSYELINGPIPDGLQVDHTCWTPSCVNPAHLRAVTPAENQANRRLVVANGRPGSVSWNKSKQKWRAVLWTDGRAQWGGWHQTREAAEAALAILIQERAA